MRSVVFGDPDGEILWEPVRISLFVPLDGSPEPAQPSELVGIGKIGTAS